VSTLSRHVANTFSSLKVRNYRIFFIVQLISVTGTWMQQVAQAWLVLKLTGSGVALGITAALQFLPTLLLASFGGLTADRTDKRKLLMVTQSTSGLLALALAALTLSGHVQLWMVWSLAFCLGVVSSFDNPTRQSFVVEMVGRDRLTNAVSLNSAVFTSARVVGPAVAGLVIALVGTGWCFLYNGLSYLPVVAGLALMRPRELFRTMPVRRTRGQLVEGLRYAWSHPGLRRPLILMAIIGTLSLNFSVVLPLMATNVFNGGSGAFGLLFSTMGVGSLLGALLSAARSSPTQRLLATAAVSFGALMTAAAVMPNFPLELAVLLPMGLFMVTLQATANSLLQLNSDPAFRGRVMALYVTVFIGTTPIGGLLIGFITQHFGARSGMALGGVAALLSGLTVWFLMRRSRLVRSTFGQPEQRLESAS
jgi:MFS family permease